MKKFKKLTAVLLSVIMALSAFTALPLTASAAESGASVGVSDHYITVNNQSYGYTVLYNGTVEITEYLGGELSVIIPDTIDGKPVTSIGDYAFTYFPKLSGVYIPDTVTNIGRVAFSGCNDLIGLRLSNNLNTIGEGAFSDCSGLTELTFPNSLTSIGEGAFSYCTALSKITFYEGLTNIGRNAFFECKSIKSLNIPASVTFIDGGAFQDCTALSEVTACGNSTRMGDNVFDGTAWYEKQPDGMVFIGDVLYNYKGEMPQNTSITIPDGVTVISNFAFSNCVGLTSVIIPDSVTVLGSRAFGDCPDLKSVSIPNSITSIPDYTFSWCTSLTDITIPESVTSIGECAFSCCTSLKSITIPDNINKIEFATFMDSGLTSLIIPNGVTRIEDCAFSDCKNLTSVTISDSVTSTGWGIFENCLSLMSVTIPENLTDIGETAFGYTCDDKWNKIPIDGFKIYGSKNSAAETYANANGFEFIAVTKKEITDASSSVKISGMIRDGVELNISEIENTFENSLATYDITLREDGREVQPDGIVTIKIPYDQSGCKVMWLRDDGTAQDMNARYEDGFYVFTTEHLSVYAIVRDFSRIKGDVNGDKKITIDDATCIIKFIAKITKPDGSPYIDINNSEDMYVSDLDGSGTISVRDATILQKYLANFIDSL